MKARFIIFLLVMLAVLNFASAATLHGAVYDSSYNHIKNVQLEINTTPKQHHISKNGLYFFYVPLGTYEITVEKYYQKQLAYSTTKIVKVTKDGEFNIDIIVEKQPGVEIPPDEEDLGPSIITLLRARFGYLFYAALAFMMILGGIVFLFFLWYALRKKKAPTTAVPTIRITSLEKSQNEIKPEEAPSENLEGIMKIIKEEGGRTTQKDIRRKIPLSEAKISLMISELEAQGKVQRIKKGRGNIIILR